MKPREEREKEILATTLREWRKIMKYQGNAYRYYFREYIPRMKLHGFKYKDGVGWKLDDAVEHETKVLYQFN